LTAIRRDWIRSAFDPVQQPIARESTAMNDKTAVTDHPIHALIAARWSPYGFSERHVSRTDLCALF
jgi:hypothetical protein